MNTIYRLIKLNRLFSNHRVKFSAVLAAHTFGLRHLAVRLDPVMACNLRCTMCFFSNEDYARNVKGTFTEAELDRIASMFFPKALLVVIGCGTEPTLYKNFPGLVKLAREYRVPNVGFVTNGQLLKDDHIAQFIRHKLDELTISVHGVEKETYERFMVNSSFDRLHEVLHSLEAVKTRLHSSLPRLRLNYTANAANLKELHRFFDVYGKYNIHTLQIRPIIDFHGQYRDLLTSNDLPVYNAAIASLRVESKARGIVLLANTTDPTYHTENHSSVILQAVHRRITPIEVWRPDFDWRSETYDDYCKKIGWRRYLLKSIFSDVRSVAEHSTGAWGKHSAMYEVDG